MQRQTIFMWTGASAWWLLTGLVWTGQMHEAFSGQVASSYLLRTEMAKATLWIPFTMFLFWWVGRHPMERGSMLRSIGWLTVAVAGIVVMRALCVAAFNPWIGWHTQLPSWSALLRTSFLSNVLTAWMIIGVAHALLFARRERLRQQQHAELHSQLSQARFEALAARLDPHFLFNALHSISEVMHRDVAAADRMVVGLGGLLRQSIDGGATQQTTLGEQIELVEDYVAIEQVRLGPRLCFHLDVDESLSSVVVPRLLLQPLVENAIRYAVVPRLKPGSIRVTAQRHENRLILEVCDDGSGEAAATPGHGVGLASTRARLQCLYGDDFRFEVETSLRSGTCVHIDIPMQQLSETE
ncbi:MULTISPECIES: histidine kinase [unclassified Lysobacter]|uniref:sensor histidine kinase n=1 Tax=unclassified Lysobacter TaxID=2635362 RepID=UPI001BE5866C|nr:MULTISPECIES: histidine kinase [unclassified Lysobacter]MBT2748755.1 histidine kinase [Lysobacter sp. ISL-42]MBT2751690.1 histidine kinase [Lysobacter sp. ISL-50]MBT2775884.1 histidine kinase [Lysobacter sp. ISL-54]MBT2782152.1 histidine kinase [Lysobacter sp. ISL-52]